MKRHILGLWLLLWPMLMSWAQSEAQYEYWVDTDYATATRGSVAIPTSGGGSLSFDIDLLHYSPGLHRLNFRSRSDNGEWGALSRFTFYLMSMEDVSTVDGYEYWIDANYAGRTEVSNTTEVPNALQIDLNGLPTGIHYFTFRSHCSDGSWGAISRFMFYLQSANDTESLAAYEYWVDRDYEHRTTVSSSTAPTSLNIDISSLSAGIHYLNFRVQTTDGEWGALSRYLFYVNNYAEGQLANIEYWIDERQDVMTQQVTDSTVVIMVDISQMEKGSHTFYMEGVATNGARGMLNGYEFTISESPAVVEPYAVLSDNNTVLTFYYDDQKTARNGMGVGPFSNTGDRGWDSNRDKITHVVFDSSFANDSSITSTGDWFFGLSNLTNVNDIKYLNTQNVTHMWDMFAYCSSLTSLDLSSLNTQSVTTMSGMFEGCSSLKGLDLSSFNTQNVVAATLMFANCTNLVNLNISNFNTSKIASMSDMFIGTSSLASIQAGSTAIPDSIYAQIDNPNLLVYVNDASLAPNGVQNVVINGTAREIVLTDAASGNNNFYVPQAFTAERITYTRNFAQQTQPNVSRGWESISLPFNVQNIAHETKGDLSPFGSSAEGKKFWLRRLADNGLTRAYQIEANVPYVISMPNSTEYTDLYNLAGRVTFSAENTTVPATTQQPLSLADSSIVMLPAMQRVDRSSAVWALNVGEVRGRYLEGSVFERDYRQVRPFEAYTVHREENSHPAPRYVPIMEIGGVTGIETIDHSPLTNGQWYDLNGRKLQGKPKAKGVYIDGNRKVVVK